MSDHLKIQKRVLTELGDVAATILLADLHQRATSEEEWMARSAEGLQDDWLLTRRLLERGRDLLINRGYIEMKRAGIPSRTWYRVTSKGMELQSGGKQ